MQAGRGPRPPKTRPLIIPNPLTVNLTVDGSLSGVPAPGGRDFHLLVNAGQRLTVVEWAIVFDVPVGLPFCDPVPMAPRAPAGTPQVLTRTNLPHFPGEQRPLASCSILKDCGIFTNSIEYARNSHCHPHRLSTS